MCQVMRIVALCKKDTNFVYFFVTGKEKRI